LEKLIVRPLQKYCEIVGHFREENLFIRANFNQNQEMKVLSDSFNAMAETLQDYSEKMESKVKERTHQLQVYNEELLNIQRQIQAEMQMGQRIQEAIIPQITFTEIDCAGFYRPMEQLGGDYYDIVSLGDKKYAFVIADVCGHGIPAAMVTMMAKISFQKNIRLYINPEDVIQQVNFDLCKITANKKYLAAFYGELDLNANILTYSNAALTEILLVQKDGSLQRLIPNSSIIGYLEKLPLETATISTKETSKIILYTDGITESENNGERYGVERLESIVVANKDKSANALKNIIIDDLNSFMPLENAKDDLTLLVINLDTI
jgi:sigma-B regulation protein RsbU (phosphoserine phosphatase)